MCRTHPAAAARDAAERRPASAAGQDVPKRAACGGGAVPHRHRALSAGRTGRRRGVDTQTWAGGAPLRCGGGCGASTEGGSTQHAAALCHAAALRRHAARWGAQSVGRSRSKGLARTHKRRYRLRQRHRRVARAAAVQHLRLHLPCPALRLTADAGLDSRQQRRSGKRGHALAAQPLRPSGCGRRHVGDDADAASDGRAAAMAWASLALRLWPQREAVAPCMVVQQLGLPLCLQLACCCSRPPLPNSAPHRSARRTSDAPSVARSEARGPMLRALGGRSVAVAEPADRHRCLPLDVECPRAEQRVPSASSCGERRAVRSQDWRRRRATCPARPEARGSELRRTRGRHELGRDAHGVMSPSRQDPKRGASPRRSANEAQRLNSDRCRSQWSVRRGWPTQIRQRQRPHSRPMCTCPVAALRVARGCWARPSAKHTIRR